MTDQKEFKATRVTGTREYVYIWAKDLEEAEEKARAKGLEWTDISDARDDDEIEVEEA